MKQTRMDSFMESLVNIAIGLAISTVANLVLLGMILGFPMSVAENVLISSVFTAISLVRSYCIRRAFNGKSVWSAIKGIRLQPPTIHRLAALAALLASPVLMVGSVVIILAKEVCQWPSAFAGLFYTLATGRPGL